MRNITRQGENFFLLEAGGSDFEIGRQIGLATAGDIAYTWENFVIPRLVEWYGTPKEKFGETYAWLRKNLEKVCPWAAEQIDGIADGSGIEKEKIWIFNHYTVLWPAHGLFCTSVAVRNSDVGPVLAQNLDIGSEDFYYMTKLRPSKAYATLSDAMVTMCWSPTGINSKGLAVGSSNLASQARKVEKPLSGGIPNILLPRMVLRQCATTAEAVEYLKTLPPICPLTAGYQLNIIDITGDMAVVDKTGPYTIVRQCQKDLNFTTNYSLDEKLETWRMEGAPFEKSRNYRMRAGKILDEYKKLNGTLPAVVWLKELFHSHKGEGRICRHGSECEGGYSRLHFIYYPRQFCVEATNGIPCENTYQKFCL